MNRDLLNVWRRLRAAGWQYQRKNPEGTGTPTSYRAWVSPDGREVRLNSWINPDGRVGSVWLSLFGPVEGRHATVGLTNRTITVREVVELATTSALQVIRRDELGLAPCADVADAFLAPVDTVYCPECFAVGGFWPYEDTDACTRCGGSGWVARAAVAGGVS